MDWGAALVDSAACRNDTVARQKAARRTGFRIGTWDRGNWRAMDLSKGFAHEIPSGAFGGSREDSAVGSFGLCRTAEGARNGEGSESVPFWLADGRPSRAAHFRVGLVRWLEWVRADVVSTRKFGGSRAAER